MADETSSVSTHISVRIDRPVNVVYEFTSNPEHLPEWASGLGSGMEHVDGKWLAHSPMGLVEVAFAPTNEFGVLDHVVTTDDGQRFYNPMRVISAGTPGTDDASEVVFSLRGIPNQTEEEAAADEATIRSDLNTLKQLLERSHPTD